MRTCAYADADALPQPERTCGRDREGRCARAESGDVGTDAWQLSGGQCTEEGNVGVELIEVCREVRAALGGQSGVVSRRLEQGEDVDLRFGFMTAVATASRRTGIKGGGAGLMFGTTDVSCGSVGFVVLVVRGSGGSLWVCAVGHLSWFLFLISSAGTRLLLFLLCGGRRRGTARRRCHVRVICATCRCGIGERHPAARNEGPDGR